MPIKKNRWNEPEGGMEKSRVRHCPHFSGVATEGRPMAGQDKCEKALAQEFLGGIKGLGVKNRVHYRGVIGAVEGKRRHHSLKKSGGGIRNEKKAWITYKLP